MKIPKRPILIDEVPNYIQKIDFNSMYPEVEEQIKCIQNRRYGISHHPYTSTKITNEARKLRNKYMKEIISEYKDEDSVFKK